MTDTEKLERAIKAAGLTKRFIAKKLGISEMALYKKINNVTEFKASEIAALCELLSIENKIEIFFAGKVI